MCVYECIVVAAGGDDGGACLCVCVYDYTISFLFTYLFLCIWVFS